MPNQMQPHVFEVPHTVENGAKFREILIRDLRHAGSEFDRREQVSQLHDVDFGALYFNFFEAVAKLRR